MKTTRWAASILALAMLSSTGLAVAQGYGPGPWDAAPQEFREIQRQGFHDGIEGARRDFDNHRRPNVNNRDEFRHPHVPPSARADYREGFERGYQVAVAHLYGGRPY